MFYKRKLCPDLLAHAQQPAVTVLTGMRRTGKTTLVKRLLADLPNKNSLYLDLQRADNRELFGQKNYEIIREAFIAAGLIPDRQMIVAIDEIQLAPEVSSVIKYLYDHHQIKFIVTGSSSYYLKNLFSESLSGRKKIFELYPLDFGEYLTFKKLSFAERDWRRAAFDVAQYNRLTGYYEDYIRFGGFPEVVLAATEAEKQDLLLDIMSSYINIDVRTLADFANERNLYKLAKLLAVRVGSRIDYSKIASIIGLSRHTVANYITFFEKTYLVNTISVYTKNADREVVKARKVYFGDTGLANSLAQLSSGAQFENTIFNQLARQAEVRYFAKKTGQEIDFVADGWAIEAKETPIEADLKQLERVAADADLRNWRLVGRYESPRFTDYAWGGSIV